MGRTSFCKKLGLSLAALAIFSLSLLQVNPSYAAGVSQGRQVPIVLSQGQLVTLARQDHALYRHVMDAHNSNSRLVVTERQYQLLSHLKIAYLSSAKAGQTAGTTPAPGTPGNPIVVPKSATPAPPACTAPTTGPLVSVITQACSAEGPIATFAAFLGTLWAPLALIAPAAVIFVIILIVINDLIVLFEQLQPQPAPSK